MTRIIMIRHGQSEANAQSRFAGHSDFDLTEIGKRQAAIAADYLYGKEELDVIYSSDLKRAHNTALPFSQKYGLPINDRTDLRELFAGDWEGRSTREINEIYADDFRVWREDFSNARCTGGESVAELYERIVAAVKSLAEQNKDKCILIATHATPIRAIEAHSRGLSADKINQVPFVRNAALNIFEYGDGEIHPVRTDIVDHLEGELVTGVPRALKA